MAKDDSDTKYYCGIKPVPKGYQRGSTEYCIQTNQVRYYGLEKIDPKLIDQFKGSNVDLQKEKIKLSKIENDAKLLIKESKVLNLILSNEKSSEVAKKKATKKMDKLVEKRDKLVKKLKAQEKLIKDLEKLQEKTKKAKK